MARRPDELEILHNEHLAMQSEIETLKRRGEALRAAFAYLMAQRDRLDADDFLAALSRMTADSYANIAALRALADYSEERIASLKGGSPPSIALYLQGDRGRRLLTFWCCCCVEVPGRRELVGAKHPHLALQ
jgi:hypothetical protein